MKQRAISLLHDAEVRQRTAGALVRRRRHVPDLREVVHAGSDHARLQHKPINEALGLAGALELIGDERCEDVVEGLGRAIGRVARNDCIGDR